MRFRAKYVGLWQPPTVESVVEKYRASYYRDGKWGRIFNGNAEDVWNKLVNVKTLDEFDQVIGNKSWTHYACDGCYDYERVIVAIGESEPKHYCKQCLTEAYELAQEALK